MLKIYTTDNMYFLGKLLTKNDTSIKISLPYGILTIPNSKIKKLIFKDSKLENNSFIILNIKNQKVKSIFSPKKALIKNKEKTKNLKQTSKNNLLIPKFSNPDLNKEIEKLKNYLKK